MSFNSERFDALLRRSSRLSGMRDSVAQELSTTINTKSRLKDEKALLDRIILVFKRLVETATQEDLSKISEFATDGLKTVLYDQDIQCIFSTLTKSGTPTLSIEGKEGPVRGPFLTTFGGGTWNVVSFVLRIIVILRLGMKRRLFLDESFSKISDQYQLPMSQLVRSLADKLGFKILLVTHQQTFAEEADRAYGARSCKGALELVQLK